MATATLPRQDLWVLVPPGWIEFSAFSSDEAATRWFDRLLAKTPDLFDEQTRVALRVTYAQVRSQIPAGLVDSAGALITTLLDDTVTMWQFSMRVLDLPRSGDINPMAVVERFLESEQGRSEVGEDDIVESFQTEDGRDGVAIHTTATAVDDGGQLVANVPGTDPAALGVVYAAVRLHRQEGSEADRLAVVTGIAPNIEQRLPMSIIAAQLTLSAELRDEGADPPEGSIDVDTTGRFDQTAG
ncbi:MAG: hypothetical protein ACRDO1_00740 [Nocardioidaceae bacterium]